MTIHASKNPGVHTCSCCNGNLPMESVWDLFRDEGGECDGSVDGTRCRAYGEDAWDCHEMATVLLRHGDRFSGNCPAEMAQEWIDHGFSATTADAWCEIGCWEPATAAAWRDAEMTPEEIKAVAERLIEDSEDPTEDFTDGDPIYSACNGDTDPDDLVVAKS